MIEFQNVTKSFKEHLVLDNISMRMRKGEITVIIGPSGCGKTTSLKMINRLVAPTSGEIFVNGRNIQTYDKTKMRRQMGYVIQQGGLFPHLTVRQNIEIIEKLEKKEPGEITQKTMNLMQMVDMDPEEYLEKYPNQLSGGQQQRVGVARAFANNPDIILFDEPFSALDPITRNSLQEELLEIQAQEAKTIVFVTHDMNEAIKVADRICIMNEGHIIQYDVPERILKQPADEFVENFVGSNRIWSQPEYIKVREFMIQEPVTCRPETKLLQCSQKMAALHVDTLPVVDTDGILQGMITRRSFANLPHRLAQARDVMVQPQITAHPEDSILDVLSWIQDSDSNNVPVVDDMGRLQGLLTSSNLVATLSQQFIAVSEGDEEIEDEEVKA